MHYTYIPLLILLLTKILVSGSCLCKISESLKNPSKNGETTGVVLMLIS
ncbi:hypothetical protein RchiOBHm_Chr2g0147451 [Rosa chinensis]|uniref:Uncharacterized protein n=1 Tax=Rosa chinensis TaxID=74649 RepID=A0A2P6RZ47_ROSCH|nr:hypothetical protein RchiOBHm_Chr2g0147451 [Rosa chinensis]